jgi:hypothetical protein
MNSTAAIRHCHLLDRKAKAQFKFSELDGQQNATTMVVHLTGRISQEDFEVQRAAGSGSASVSEFAMGLQWHRFQWVLNPA